MENNIYGYIMDMMEVSLWVHNSSSLKYIAGIMGELIGGCAGAIWQYAWLFEGCSQEKEKITAIMEEVASVHSLL